MAIAAGTTINRYEVRAPLGKGGMGEVYLAHDTQLNRSVALKILPSHLASDKERMRRFTQEARAASALNHPNIITIYEIGRVDSTNYIATEFVSGVTLRQIIGRAGMTLRDASGMTLRDVFDMALQIAAALDAAHAAGIIHRDIKPENIMLREDGYVKVLDFGLAKLTEKVYAGEPSDPEAPTQSRIDTDPGVVMGTVQYMSPEQARGLPVDARTDIWSLGIVLYEVVTGRLPFKGQTSSDVIALILEREPIPVTEHAPEVPKELERIITKALAKDAEDRYQTVKDLLIDIRRLKKQLEIEAALERSVKPTVTGEGQKPTDGGGPATETDKNSTDKNLPAGEQHDSAQVSSAEYLIGEIKNHKRVVFLALLLLLTAIGGLTYRFTSRKPSVAVLPFSYRAEANQSADPVMEELAEGLTNSLINNLPQLSKLSVKPRSTVFRYKGPEVDAQKAGRELGARWVLTGRVFKHGTTLIVQAELDDVDNESHIWGDTYKLEQPQDIMGGSESINLQEDLSKQIMDKVRAKLSAYGQ